MDQTRDIVWKATYENGTIIGQVYRTEHYHGVLQVIDATDGKVLYEAQVGYVYAAMFGPEEEDYALWRKQVSYWLQRHVP